MIINSRRKTVIIFWHMQIKFILLLAACAGLAGCVSFQRYYRDMDSIEDYAHQAMSIVYGLEVRINQLEKKPCPGITFLPDPHMPIENNPHGFRIFRATAATYVWPDDAISTVCINCNGVGK